MTEPETIEQAIDSQIPADKDCKKCSFADKGVCSITEEQLGSAGETYCDLKNIND